MGRKPFDYNSKQKHFFLPIYLCKKLDTVPNQTQFIIKCLERGLEINNTTLERLVKKKKELEENLTELTDEIEKIQKEKLTKAELRKKEQERFLKDRYERLCNKIISSSFPAYYITNAAAHKEIIEKYNIVVDQKIIDKIKQDCFSFEEYKKLSQNKDVK